jgi:hypothetical protein
MDICNCFIEPTNERCQNEKLKNSDFCDYHSSYCWRDTRKPRLGYFPLGRNNLPAPASPPRGNAHAELQNKIVRLPRNRYVSQHTKIDN